MVEFKGRCLFWIVFIYFIFGKKKQEEEKLDLLLCVGEDIKSSD